MTQDQKALTPLDAEALALADELAQRMLDDRKHPPVPRSTTAPLSGLAWIRGVLSFHDERATRYRPLVQTPEWVASIFAFGAEAVEDQASNTVWTKRDVQPWKVPGLGIDDPNPDPAWAFESRDDAIEAGDLAGSFCKYHCSLLQRCVEGRCRVFRLETLANEFERRSRPRADESRE